MAKRRPNTVPNRRKKPKKRNRLFRWLSNIFLLLLLLVGLALVFNDQIKNWIIQSNTDRYAIDSLTREDIEKNMGADATFDFDQVISISTEEVLRAQFLDEDLPVIGAVALPDVGINLPIFKGVAYNALFYGAGTTSPEQVMGEGNYGLASHRAADMSLLFSPLEQSQEGQLIYLTDLTNIYSYEIYAKRRVPPTEVSVLDVIEDKKIITLITCGDGAGTNRLVVQGELKKITPVQEASQAMTNAFNLGKNTY